MVDLYGNWMEEKDYSIYPKEKWCFMDYMAVWIRKQNYRIKTDMENLIDMMFEHHNSYTLETGTAFGDDSIPDSELYFNIEAWAEDVQCYVMMSGGIEEFDYYP